MRQHNPMRLSAYVSIKKNLVHTKHTLDAHSQSTKYCHQTHSDKNFFRKLNCECTYILNIEYRHFHTQQILNN